MASWTLLEAGSTSTSDAGRVDLHHQGCDWSSGRLEGRPRPGRRRPRSCGRRAPRRPAGPTNRWTVRDHLLLLRAAQRVGLAEDAEGHHTLGRHGVGEAGTGAPSEAIVQGEVVVEGRRQDDPEAVGEVGREIRVVIRDLRPRLEHDVDDVLGDGQHDVAAGDGALRRAVTRPRGGDAEVVDHFAVRLERLRPDAGWDRARRRRPRCRGRSGGPRRRTVCLLSDPAISRTPVAQCFRANRRKPAYAATLAQVAPA